MHAQLVICMRAQLQRQQHAAGLSTNETHTHTHTHTLNVSSPAASTASCRRCEANSAHCTPPWPSYRAKCRQRASSVTHTCTSSIVVRVPLSHDTA
jgi:hypothetical protein